MPAALLVNKLNASNKQIQTSNSIALLHSVVFSAGVGFGVVGFLDAGVGFVQCRQLARQAARPANKHIASTKKIINSQICSSKSNHLMQSFATILHQFRPKPTQVLDSGSRSGHQPQRPGPRCVPSQPGFLGSRTPPRPGPPKGRGLTRSYSRCQHQRLFKNPPSLLISQVTHALVS